MHWSSGLGIVCVCVLVDMVGVLDVVVLVTLDIIVCELFPDVIN